jgi:hypothetical protein
MGFFATLKEKLSTGFLSKVKNDIAERIDKNFQMNGTSGTDVMSVAAASKGDVRRFKYFSILDESIRSINRTFGRRQEQEFMQMARLLTETLNALVTNRDIFHRAFTENRTTLMLTYATALANLSLITTNVCGAIISNAKVVGTGAVVDLDSALLRKEIGLMLKTDLVESLQMITDSMKLVAKIRNNQ